MYLYNILKSTIFLASEYSVYYYKLVNDIAYINDLQIYDNDIITKLCL